VLKAGWYATDYAARAAQTTDAEEKSDSKPSGETASNGNTNGSSTPAGALDSSTSGSSSTIAADHRPRKRAETKSSD